MPLCIFCSDVLAPDTKPEHLLLDAFGGRLATRTADCSACNERFGGTIDSVFAAQFNQLRNLLQLKSGSGGSPPKLPKVQAGNLTFGIAGDGTMELGGKPFTVEKQTDGSWSLQIQARSAAHLQSHLPNIAAKIGIPTEALNAQMRASATVTEQAVWPSPVDMSLQMGGPDALRSMMKAVLVLWSMQVGNDEVRSQAYAAARRFVTDGDETFNLTRIHLDTRRLPCAKAATEAYGPLFNLIYVRSDERGRVVAHFTLYNLVGWQLVLAEEGGAPNRRIALISNPENPRDWSAESADLFDLPMTWLNQPEANVGIARDRMIDMHQHYRRTATVRQLGRIVDEAALALGFKQDQPVPPDQLQALVAVALGRIGRMFMRLPEQRQLTPEEIAALVGGR